ncbi:MAG: phosphoribosylformylglycinamidine cyclo-ligase [Polyangiaceae bacterium]
MAITYRQAGVDIDAGDELVDRIKPLARATRTAHVLADVGGFAGMCRIPPGMSEPILVSGTDGVGTKLKIAFATGEHSTIGQDLVAMCVNDVVTCGALPLFFLDYFATGRLEVGVAERVIKGIADGCSLAGCALLGGETAELPGMYADGEYDLAGFSVGVVEKANILDGKGIRAGDIVVGVPSSGLHSNGYSLARRVLLDVAKLSLDAHIPELGRTLGAELLTPTRIYAKAVAAMLEVKGGVQGLSHITGGGLPGNVPRILPDGLGVCIRRSSWVRPAIFDMIAKLGPVEETELARAFNLGIGLVALVRPEHVDAVIAKLNEAGEKPFVAGEVEAVPADTDFEARVRLV